MTDLFEETAKAQREALIEQTRVELENQKRKSRHAKDAADLLGFQISRLDNFIEEFPAHKGASAAEMHARHSRTLLQLQCSAAEEYRDVCDGLVAHHENWLRDNG